jgi:hypothetical protein
MPQELAELRNAVFAGRLARGSHILDQIHEQTIVGRGDMVLTTEPDNFPIKIIGLDLPASVIQVLP